LIPRIALTSGEPAGVGPDLCLAIAREALGCELVCLGDRGLLAERAAALKLPVTLSEYDASKRAAHTPGRLHVLHVPLGARSVPGKLDRANARYVLNLIDRAIEGAVSGEFDAITAPVQKS
jgi:4-hydroxythreonine-4-phosphate dehydrogenase